MFPDFSKRSDQLELMDDAGAVSAAEMRGTLAGIARVNTVLSGYGPSITGVDKLRDRHAARLRVLDVGTGSADTPRKICDWAASHDIDVDVTGIDLSPNIVDYARLKCRNYPNIHIQLRNLFDIPDSEQFDVVHAALVLHHFPGDGAIKAIRKMYALSRRGVVVNDLHRHPLSYVGSLVVLPMLSRNRLVIQDGALSILRAFTRQELVDMAARAGVFLPEITWHPLFRWQMIIRKAPIRDNA